MRYTSETERKLILELTDQGYTVGDIAQRTSLSYDAVEREVKSYKAALETLKAAGEAEAPKVGPSNAAPAEPNPEIELKPPNKTHHKKALPNLRVPSKKFRPGLYRGFLKSY